MRGLAEMFEILITEGIIFLLVKGLYDVSYSRRGSIFSVRDRIPIAEMNP